MSTLLLMAVGVLLISLASILIWRSASRVAIKWFGVGALLWSVAVPLKLAFSLLITSAHIIGPLKEGLPYAYFIAAAGLFLGAESSAFEVGVTWIAARIWPRLGCDSGRAIAIGLGAGAFEALLLGLVALIAALTIAEGDVEDVEEIRRITATTSLFGLLPVVERLIGMLVHTSTRALVVLGVAKGKPLMVCCGFLLFAAIDGVGSAFIITGSYKVNPWWAELAILPCALVSIPLLRWCHRRWRNGGDVSEALCSI